MCIGPARWVHFVKSSSQSRHIREQLGACARAVGKPTLSMVMRATWPTIAAYTSRAPRDSPLRHSREAFAGWAVGDGEGERSFVCGYGIHGQQAAMPSSTWRTGRPVRMDRLVRMYYVAAYDARWRLAIIASIHPSIAALEPHSPLSSIVPPASCGAKHFVRRGDCLTSGGLTPRWDEMGRHGGRYIPGCHDHLLARRPARPSIRKEDAAEVPSPTHPPGLPGGLGLA